jgi:hypothetical protein
MQLLVCGGVAMRIACGMTTLKSVTGNGMPSARAASN